MRLLLCTFVAFALLGGGLAYAQPAAELDAGPVEEDAGPVATSPLDPGNAAEPDVIGVIEKIVDGVRLGQWRLVGSAVLVLAMILLRNVRQRVKWFAGDRGGAVLVGLLGLLGALASALATSEPIDLKLLLGALTMTWIAVGGWNWVRRLLWPDRAEPGEP